MKAEVFESCMNAAWVKRWHTSPTVVVQDVGNHTYRVLQTLLYLTDGEASRELLIRALMHDVPEVELGDIPFGHKLPENEKREERWIEQMGMPHPKLSEEEEELLKQADMLEMAFYASEEAMRGNRRMLKVVLNVMEWFDGKAVQGNVGQSLEALERWIRRQAEANAGGAGNHEE